MEQDWLMKQIKDAQQRRDKIPEDRKPYARFTGGDSRKYVHTDNRESRADDLQD